MPSSLPTLPIVPGTLGVKRDKSFLDLTERELWDSLNWIEENGILVTRPGMVPFGTAGLDERVMGIKQFRHPSAGLVLCAVTTRGLYRYNPTTQTWTDLTPATPELTGSASQHVVMRTLSVPGTYNLLFTNGEDQPMYWTYGAANYLPFSAAPSAKTMAVCFNRVILGNLTSGANANPQQIDVSAEYDFNHGWNGDVQTRSLSDLEGEIVHLEAYGNRRVNAYLEDGIYAGDAITARESFGWSLIESGTSGPISPAAFCRTPFGHVWIAIDYSLRIFDGVKTSVFGRHVTAFLASMLSDEKRNRSWLIYCPGEVPNAGYLIAGFPGRASDDVDLGFYLNPLTEALYPVRWGKNISAAQYVDISTSAKWSDYAGLTWDTAFAGLAWEELQSIRGRALFGDSLGDFYEHSGGDDDSAAIPHFFQTGTSPLTDPREAKIVQQAWHLFSPTSSPTTVDVGFPTSVRGEVPDDDPDPKPIDLASDEDFETTHGVRGRLLSMKMSGNTTERLEYRGSRVVVRKGGWR